MIITVSVAKVSDYETELPFLFKMSQFRVKKGPKEPSPNLTRVKNKPVLKIS